MKRPKSFDDLVLRAYRGPQDHPYMSRVAAAVRARNGDRDLGSVADMDNFYGHLDQVDLVRDCALVQADGEVVAYGRASWFELANGDAKVDAILNIRPETAGRGVEERLVDHAIDRASELVIQRARDRVVLLSIYVTSRDGAQRDVLERRGFRIVRSGAQLIRPDLEAIPDLLIATPYEVRPIDPADGAMHRRVFEAAVRAFDDSYGQEVQTADRLEAFLNDPSFSPHLWCVAFDGDRIAGQILNYLGEREADGSLVGWTEAISVQPEDRRRGLARAMLARSLQIVRAAGATSAGLGVDAQNPNQALTLYQSMGYEIVSETFEYAIAPADALRA